MHLGRRRLIAVSTVVAALSSTGALVAKATQATAPGSGAEVAARWSATPPGPQRLVRSLGLTTTGGVPVFAGSGIEASVVSNATGRCLVRRGIAGGATCGTLAEVNRGETISVTDECGTSEADRMTISGLAPDGTATVRLARTDGSSEDSVVQAGAFLFEGTNPHAGEPYPDGVTWLNSSGAAIGSSALPVQGDRFCI